jgi:hypothetical protein
MSTLRSLVCALSVGLLALGAASRASAAPDTSANDAEVEVLVQSVFEAEYPQKQFVEALEKLQLASTVCQEGSCGAKMRARVLIGVATVLAGGLDQKNDAIEVFKIALKEDPKVQLIKGFDTGAIKAAWDTARGQSPSTGPKEIERKKYPGGRLPPKGWKSAEGFFYYQEAVKAEDERSWALCAGYAGDSFAAEPRVATRYLRARCNDSAGNWVDAVSDYEAVSQEAGKLGMPESAAKSKTRFDEMTSKMPKLVLRPPQGAENLEVFLDDEPISPDKLGGEIWVNPGQRRIRANGKISGQSLSFQRDLTMNEGKVENVDIKLVPATQVASDNRVLKCLEKSKSRDELAECIGEGTGRPVNVRIASEVSGYTDSDNTSVFSPAVVFRVTSPTDGWTIGGSFLVDVVTTASTDIVATASPRWTETRYVPGLNGSKKFGDVTIGASTGLSIEPDYLSIAAGANFSADVLDKRLTPSVAYGFGYDIQGRSGTSFDAFRTIIYQNSVDAGLSIVADKATVVTVGATVIFQNGDTSKPYRYVPLFAPEIVGAVQPGLVKEEVNRVRAQTRALEQLPTDRQRYAVSGRVAHRFEASTLRVDERLYIDSWGLKASTTDAMWLFDVDQFRFWPHLRFHAQTAVDFWQLAYPVIEEPTGQIVLANFRTGDRELGPMLGASLGGGARVALGEAKNWGLTLSADAVYNRYLNHLFILERWGGFGALGVEVDIE